MENTVVYKYTLLLKERQIIELPRHAKILTVQNQGENLRLWAHVNPSYPLEKYTILLTGTGYDFSDLQVKKFIGTVQFQNGNLVFHVFEGF